MTTCFEFPDLAYRIGVSVNVTRFVQPQFGALCVLSSYKKTFCIKYIRLPAVSILCVVVFLFSFSQQPGLLNCYTNEMCIYTVVVFRDDWCQMSPFSHLAQIRYVYEYIIECTFGRISWLSVALNLNSFIGLLLDCLYRYFV